MSAAIDSDVGIGVPSKYCDFPVLSLGSAATVTLKRASLSKPQMTKNVSRTWSSGVRRPMAKATAAGEAPNDNLKIVSTTDHTGLCEFLECTKSANESSS